jgi:hypothetical protein
MKDKLDVKHKTNWKSLANVIYYDLLKCLLKWKTKKKQSKKQ